MAARSPGELNELARVFLKLGVMGFGGPAAHIALMEEIIVRRRQWLTHTEFLDLLSASNLIPGPSSTEMAIFIGYRRCGWKGLLVAGFCFIMPAAFFSLICAMLYAHYGILPGADSLFAGIQIAVIAVIAAAAWSLGKSAARSREIILLGIIAGVAAAAGLNEFVVLILGGILGALWLGRKQKSDSIAAITSGTLLLGTQSSLFAAAKTAPAILAGTTSVTGTISLAALGGFFLTVGSLLYGSGYVLVAFLEGFLVDEKHLLTRAQLLDAIAVGQLTPGPVSTTATFIGYLIHGLPGAVVCTIGIFAPSFVAVALVAPWIHKLRGSRRCSAFLDAVNIGSVALIAVVAGRLAVDVLTSWQRVVICVACLAAAFRFRTAAPCC